MKTLLTGVDDRGTSIAVPGPKPLRSVAAEAAPGQPRALPQAALGSANRRKSAARLARIHARVANVRADALHKATSGLAARYETVVAEDLNVAGMTRNSRLARADRRPGIRDGAADAGLQDQLERRRRCSSRTAGSRSSKTCSGCGAVKAKLTLAERIYRCELRPGHRTGT